MSAALVFDALFRRATPVTIRHRTGREQRFDPVAWCRDDLPGDGGLLARCTGPTLDVGCGPGRLAGELARRGCPVLGIDISATAVRLARRRGAAALRRDVFEPLPGAGRWQHVLLADGNIGIGGDPARLLRRCRRLLAAGGRVHVEVTAPGTAGWSGTAVLQGGQDSQGGGRGQGGKGGQGGDGGPGGPGGLDGQGGLGSQGGLGGQGVLAWASVPVDDLAALAAATAMRVLDTWTEAGRWFATLSPR